MSITSEWLDKLSKTKSPVTVRNYKSAFNNILNDLKLTADEIVAMSRDNPSELRRTIDKYLTDLKLAPLSKNLRFSALRSFLRYANPDFTFGRIEFDRSHTMRSIFDVEIPSQEKLARFFEYADVRTRAAAGMYAFCGLRPRLILNLTFSAFPEMRVSNGSVSFLKEPMMIIVKKDLPGNKAKVDFFTFLIREGMDYLKEYIEARDDEFVGLPDAKVIYYPETRHPEVYLWRGIKKAFKKARIKANPYILRSYFSLVASENLSQTKREFYMGHTGDLDVRYSMRKRHSKEKIEEFRHEWKRMEDKLRTRI